MAKEAEAHADEDKAKKRASRSPQPARQRCLPGEKLKKDNADKISEDDEKCWMKLWKPPARP